MSANGKQPDLGQRSGQAVKLGTKTSCRQWAQSMIMG